MGLDMSLYKKTFIRGEAITLPPKLKKIKPERVAYITEEIGYWRKANAIHHWIMKRAKLQDVNTNGVDVPLNKKDLEDLLDTCRTVLKHSQLVQGIVKNGYTITKEKGREPNLEMGEYIAAPSIAKELLPTTDGSFFGSQDYDQWYYQDLVDTVYILKEALKESEIYEEFIYNANW